MNQADLYEGPSFATVIIRVSSKFSITDELSLTKTVSVHIFFLKFQRI